MLSYGTQSLALHLSGVETSQDIPIKSLGSLFGRIPGVLGASTLGDGRQVMVINPVIMAAQRRVSGPDGASMRGRGVDEARLANSSKVTEPQESQRRHIMVVDDSLTVRRASAK